MSEVQSRLVLSSDDSIAARVVYLGAGCATLEVATARVGELQPGSSVSLVICSKHLGGEHLGVGVIDAVGKDGRPGQVIFRYADREEFSRMMAQGGGRLFNKRNAFRVRPKPNAPVLLTISAPLGEFHLAAANVSAAGCAVAVDDATASALPEGIEIELSLRLPQEKEPLVFAALVRHQGMVAGVNRVGFEFLSSATPKFAVLQNRVVAFVMQRQRQTLLVAAS